MARGVTISAVADEARVLWKRAGIRGQMSSEIERAARRIIDGRARYVAVAQLTGVPWSLIGALHYRESGCDFSRHLHNGDPLSRATVNAPKGRGPFKTWEASAVDAIKLKKWSAASGWDVGGTLARAEQWNGFGYRTRKAGRSPFVWSGTTHYAVGKFTGDGKLDRSKVDAQAGVAPILMRIMQLDRSHGLEVHAVSPASPAAGRAPEPTGTPALSRWPALARFKRKPKAGTQPDYMALAASFLGTREAPGRANSDVVMAFYRDAGHPGTAGDHVPWCAAFVSAILERCGMRNPQTLLAKDYETEGEGLSGPEFGCIGVMTRGPRSSWKRHVGFVVGWTDETVTLLGGNQSDEVNETTYDRSDFTAFRRPVPKVKGVVETVRGSRSLPSLINGALLLVLGPILGAINWAWETALWLVDALPSVASGASDGVGALSGLAGLLNIDWAPYATAAALACIMVALFRETDRKRLQ